MFVCFLIATSLGPPEGARQHRAPAAALQIVDVVPLTSSSELLVKVDNCLPRDVTSQLVRAATPKQAARMAVFLMWSVKN